jgi:hypothetical protein
MWTWRSSRRCSAIRINDAATGENLLRFNCGANKGKARELVAAAQPS